MEGGRKRTSMMEGKDPGGELRRRHIKSDAWKCKTKQKEKRKEER